MKSLVVLGNWKANKTIEEAKIWIEAFSTKFSKALPNLTIILCPAYHHLPLFLEAKLPASVGVQDVSQFQSGAYTGEISAAMLGGLATHVLLGHSERRKNFGETDEIISQKVTQCLSVGITPIVCISELVQAQKLKALEPKFTEKGMILYEPLFAIGSGQADTPPNANATALKLTEIFGRIPVLYGGSVTAENVAGFIKQEYISGVGVGGASLDPMKFFQLISAAIANS